MSVIITSIHNCPVKSISFQNIEKCKINKNVGIEGDRVFAFSQNLNLDQSVIIFNKAKNLINMENEPAFKRAGINFDDVEKIKDSNGEINLQIDKSFLHDNVD